MRLLFLALYLCPVLLLSQAVAPGRLSGNLQLNGNFFQRDSLIGAANIPQYDRQQFGGEAWLNLNYSVSGFDLGLRFDAFTNSNLLNPTDSYTAQGIGMWYARKQIDRLHLWGGYIYDQIGSGIIFRAFEERPLLIDNALIGARVQYDLGSDWRVRAFVGRQKQQFDVYGAVMRGLALEGFVALDTSGRASLVPGFGAVGRTLDDASMNNLVATLNTYPEMERFVPRYNTYAFSLYNTLTLGPLRWYVEGAYKTDDNLNDPFGQTVRGSDTIVGNQFFRSHGSVLYSSLSYTAAHWGVALEGKRTDNFSFRTRPQSQLNRGIINFLPAMTRVNTYRLTSRYLAATQELGEWAVQLDLRYAPSRKFSVNINGAYLDDLAGTLLYRELYTELALRPNRIWKLSGGLQVQRYNQERYEFKPGAPVVETVVPFVELLYKVQRTRAWRTEWQYMRTGRDPRSGLRQDYGNWLFGLVEYSLAPHWSFSLSDMWNVQPGQSAPVAESGERPRLHYPRVDAFYTEGNYRFSLSYVKQVEGVVCTGGICRLEPAFSGVRFGMTAGF